jgi:hypothetical protein
MLKLFETVKVLHLEPTDVCQAACPLCARETDPLFNKEHQHWLSVADIKRILPEKVIYRLDKMFMCGNYGDPAAGRETLAIYDYFRKVNSSIVLGMNSNGGIKASWWWTALAKRLHQPEDYVVFSIDGLEDTNHIYRKNVVWDKVMTNAEAFIKAGGQAHWDMLVYEHNEHQVDLCEKQARDMGFKWFRAKVSKRPSNISWLNPPKNWTSPVVDLGSIECFRDKEQSIYLNSEGKFSPCCWLAHDPSIKLDDFGTISANWNTDLCNDICKKTCTVNNKGTSFTNQWARSIKF